MSYFDEDAREMLEVYLLETRQLTEQLNNCLMEAEKNNRFAEEDIHGIFPCHAYDQEFFCHDGPDTAFRSCP